MRRMRHVCCVLNVKQTGHRAGCHDTVLWRLDDMYPERTLWVFVIRTLVQYLEVNRLVLFLHDDVPIRNPLQPYLWSQPSDPAPSWRCPHQKSITTRSTWRHHPFQSKQTVILLQTNRSCTTPTHDLFCSDVSGMRVGHRNVSENTDQTNTHTSTQRERRVLGLLVDEDDLTNYQLLINYQLVIRTFTYQPTVDKTIVLSTNCWYWRVCWW